MIKESIKILTSVIDETDDEDLWAESMRKKSDMLWEMSGINEKQLNYNFDPKNEYLGTVIDSTVSRFKYSFEALKLKKKKD